MNALERWGRSPDRQRPPGWTFYGALVAALGVVWWAASVPFWDYALAFVALTLLGLLAFIWSIKLYLWTRGAQSTPIRGFLIPVGLAIVLIVIAVIGVPLDLRWGHARSGFDAALETLNTTGELETPRSIGTYTVEQAFAGDDGVALFFLGEGGGFLDRVGFLHVEDGAELPPPGEADGVIDLGDGWYAFRVSF